MLIVWITIFKKSKERKECRTNERKKRWRVSSREVTSPNMVVRYCKGRRGQHPACSYGSGKIELTQRKSCVVSLEKMTVDFVAFSQGRTTLSKTWSQLREPPTLKNSAVLDIVLSGVDQCIGTDPSVLECVRPFLGIFLELVGQETSNNECDSISHQNMKGRLELIISELQKK